MRHGSLAIEGQDGKGGAPLVVAHRGAWRPAPQNSREAFEEAVQLGCDAIELDVRRTLDGRVVVVHEAHVGVRSIAKLTHEEIQSRPRHRHAPALEEVLELVAESASISSSRRTATSSRRWRSSSGGWRPSSTS